MNKQEKQMLEEAEYDHEFAIKCIKQLLAETKRLKSKIRYWQDYAAR